jgi:S-formylglutathione hydrolase FrmB
VAETVVDARTIDLTINSPAIGGNVMTRLLLPKDWATQPLATWPVLWLLHGAGEPQDYKSWTFYTNVEAFTADKNALVVMPSDGQAGFYTDWLFGGSANPRRWQTFQMVELYQILLRGYRASAANQAIGGLSLGGYGALSYAFQYPGRFKAAASYSGLVDTLWPGAPALVDAMVLRANQNPIQMWGDPILNFPAWAARDPGVNYRRLAGVRLYISCGNGTPQDGDAPIDARLLESVAAPANRALAANLGNAGVHAWPYWQARFQESWPVLAAGLGLA